MPLPDRKLDRVRRPSDNHGEAELVKGSSSGSRLGRCASRKEGEALHQGRSGGLNRQKKKNTGRKELKFRTGRIAKAVGCHSRKK